MMGKEDAFYILMAKKTKNKTTTKQQIKHPQKQALNQKGFAKDSFVYKETFKCVC